jgi:hypothetical protein
MIDFNNHRVWDQVISVGTGATGFALGTVLASFLNPVVAPVVLLAGIGLWYSGAQVIKRQEAEPEEDGVIIDHNTGRILPPNPPRPTEPEPVELEPGMKPVIKVDGKPRFAFSQTVSSVRLDKARHIAIVNLRRLERGEPADLTQETWARNRKLPNGIKKEKFCSRGELRGILNEWDARGVTCRASTAKNASRDILSVERLEMVARGRTLPH